MGLAAHAWDLPRPGSKPVTLHWQVELIDYATRVPALNQLLIGWVGLGQGDRLGWMWVRGGELRCGRGLGEAQGEWGVF